MGVAQTRRPRQLDRRAVSHIMAGAPDGAPADHSVRQTTVRLPEISCTMTAITASTSSR